MPAVTPSHVVSHPAYKRYDKSEIERMRIIVDVYDSFQRVNERVSKFGLSERANGFDHYKECVWADPLCKSGPDTCVCSLVSGECYTIVQSLNKL